MVLRHWRLLRRAEGAGGHDGRRLRHHSGSARRHGPGPTRSDSVQRSAALARWRVLALPAAGRQPALLLRPAAEHVVERSARPRASGDLPTSLHDAFTRVHSPSKTGANALEKALCARMNGRMRGKLIALAPRSATPPG